MTPFVRLLVVFHFLRQALGTQSTPSNQTLIGLALLLTFFLMQPVGADIYPDAIVPLEARADHDDERARSWRPTPLRAFHAAIHPGKRSRAVRGAGERTAVPRNPRTWACALSRRPTCCRS